MIRRFKGASRGLSFPRKRESIVFKCFFCILVSASLIIIIVITIWVKQSKYMLTYQVSASMPKGFYLVKPIKIIKRGEMVVFYPPVASLNFLLKQHWIPKNGLLMKYVMAIPGDIVCNQNGYIWINHHKVAQIYQYYAPSKLLPNSKFCGKLTSHHYLLMSIKVRRSFDGRYFGPVSEKNIVGKAIKI